MSAKSAKTLPNFEWSKKLRRGYTRHIIVFIRIFDGREAALDHASPQRYDPRAHEKTHTRSALMSIHTKNHNAGLLKTALAFIAAATTLALGLLITECSAQAKGRAWLPKPKRTLAQPPTIQHTTETIRCMVDGRAYNDTAKQRAAKKRFNKLRTEYFSPRHLNRIAHAAHDGLKREHKRFPLGLSWYRYLPLLLAHVQQQSHFKRDAISRFNRDARGHKIRVGNCKKLRADGIIGQHDQCRSLEWIFRHPNHVFTRGLDGGLFQMHVRTARLVCPGTTLQGLLTEEPNLACAATWLRKRAETCTQWLRTSKARCRKGNNSIRCKCRKVFRNTGALAYQNTSSTSLTRSGGYAAQYWQCHDVATETINNTPSPLPDS